MLNANKATHKRSNDCYRTRQFIIRSSDPLYSYLDELCFNAKNLYNAALFRIRQMMTGMQKDEENRQPNEQEVMDEIAQALPGMNAVR